MLNERAKREQLFFLYSLKASKRHVAKLHVFECDLVQTWADVQYERISTETLSLGGVPRSVMCAVREGACCWFIEVQFGPKL